MNKKIGFIGGDLRTVRLIQMMSFSKYNISIKGVEKSKDICEIKQIKICNNINELIQENDIIILPFPLSKDEEYINAQFCSNKIRINEILSYFSLLNNKDKNYENKKTIIGGNIQNEIKEKLEKQNYNVIDIMKNEELLIFNTIATAEGAIKIAIENYEKNLQGSNVLILGFGRVAKTTAKKFKSMECSITCMARKNEDLAWIETLGYSAINIYNNVDFEKYDIIINTVPQLIIDEEKMMKIRKDTLLIDLASKPGGIDFEKAKELKLKTIWALALPGKISPESSALYIMEQISKYL